MANEKIINLDNLKKFRQEYDTRISGGNIQVGKALTAKQLEPASEESGSTQTAPFLFQATGTDNNTTSTPTAPVAKHLELRGNTVVWNQLVSTPSQEINLDNTSGSSSIYEIVYIGDSSYRMKLGHKYAIKIDKDIEYTGNALVYINTINNQNSILSLNSRGDVFEVTSIQTDARPTIIFIANAGATLSFNGHINLIDLTTLGKEYSSILEFNRDYPSPYYNYDSGSLKSCKSQKLITINCDQFDGELEIGTLAASDGSEIPADDNAAIRSANFIKVIPGQYYAYEVEDFGSNTFSNYIIYEYDINYNLVKERTVKYDNKSIFHLGYDTQYIKFVSFTNNVAASLDNVKIQIRLSWGEAHDFVDYDKHEYKVPEIELRSAGNAYDVLYGNGTGKRRIGYIDLGSINWAPQTSYTAYSNGIQSIVKIPSSYNVYANILCPRYTASREDGISSGDKRIAISSSGAILINDSDLAGMTNEQIKSALSEVYLFYELAQEENIVSSLFAENIIVDDFGTMEFVPSADNLEPIIPQGNKFFYPIDVSMFIDDLYKMSKDGGTNADVNNFVTQSELEEAVGDIDLSNYVDLTSAQTITAVKTFDTELGGNIKIVQNGVEKFAIYPDANTHNTKMNVQGGAKIRFDSNQINFYVSITPLTNNSLDLGNSSVKWRDLFLSRNLTDGTNSTTVAEITKKPSTSYSLSDGGTITDNALKTLIQNEQPIKLNGFTCYFSCDDGTNYQYVSTRYDSNANKNHINVITIDKSTWVATFHTSDLTLN